MNNRTKDKINQNNNKIKSITRNSRDSKWASILATCGGCTSIIAALAYSTNNKSDAATAMLLIAAIMFTGAYSTHKYYNNSQRQIKRLRHKNNKLKSR